MASVDGQQSITQCSDCYILAINGRNEENDHPNIKRLVLKQGELVDELIGVDRAIRNQRLTG